MREMEASNPPATVICIACDRPLAVEATDEYVPLQYFDDACICRDCLAYGTAERPRPTAPERQ